LNVRSKLDQHVNVAVLLEAVTYRRTEKRKLLYLPFFSEGGDGIMVDMKSCPYIVLLALGALACQLDE
jgi:hypothetical protein